MLYNPTGGKKNILQVVYESLPALELKFSRTSLASEKKKSWEATNPRMDEASATKKNPGFLARAFESMISWAEEGPLELRINGFPVSRWFQSTLQVESLWQLTNYCFFPKHPSYSFFQLTNDLQVGFLLRISRGVAWAPSNDRLLQSLSGVGYSHEEGRWMRSSYDEFNGFGWIWMFGCFVPFFFIPKSPFSVAVGFLLSAEFLGRGLLHRPGREKTGQKQPTFLSGIPKVRGLSIWDEKKHKFFSSCLGIFRLSIVFCKPFSCCSAPGYFFPWKIDHFYWKKNSQQFVSGQRQSTYQSFEFPQLLRSSRWRGTQRGGVTRLVEPST